MQKLTQVATMAITIEAMKVELAQIQQGLEVADCQEGDDDCRALAQVEYYGSMLNNEEKQSVLSYYTTMIDMFVEMYGYSKNDAWMLFVGCNPDTDNQCL